MFNKQVVSTERSGPRTLLLALALGLVGCGAERPAPSGAPVDPDAEAIPELGMNLTAFTGTCVFTVTGGVLTVTYPAGGDTAILSKRALDGAIMANGVPCTNGATPAVTALGSTVKTVSVVGGAGDDVLIVDFANGSFAPGTATVVGMVVDLKAGSNAFKFRGQSAVDTVTLGAGAPPIAYMSLSTAFKDVSVDATTLPTFTFALSGGNDVFNTGGSTATGAAWTLPLTVYGGLGNDTFNEGASKNGDSVFWGGAGTDTVSYASRTAAITIKVDGTTDCGDQSATSEKDKINTDIESVVTGAGNDLFTVTQLPDPLGGTAYPTLTLNGGAGDDTFTESNVATGNTVFIGGAGVDTVDYSARTQALLQPLTITMGAGVNDGEAGEKDDVQSTIEKVIGGSGDDHITGSAGNDTLVGGPGSDTLDGAAGDDRFDMGSAADGNDIIIGGTGVDTVDYSARGTAITCDLNSSATVPVASGYLAGPEADDIRQDVENCIGAAAQLNTLNGNALNNELVGGSLANTFDGRGGDDTLQGGAAADTFVCGPGDDITISGGGTDVFNGPSNLQPGSDCEL